MIARALHVSVFGVTLWLALATLSGAQPTIGTYYDALHFDSAARRTADVPKLAGLGFQLLASSFPPSDPETERTLRACQQRGMRVLMAPASWAQAKALADKYPCLAAVIVQDDATNQTPASIAAKRDALRQALGPQSQVKTFITVNRAAKHAEYANLCDWYGVQLYTWGDDGSLRKYWWRGLREARAVCKGRLIAQPYLARSFPEAPWQLEDPLYTAEEYTPPNYNEAAIWLALCAGADDILFYTAANVHPANPKVYSYFLERRDLVAAYPEIFGRIRRYQPYLAGRRKAFDAGDGRRVGATFTLANGKSLRVTVDTFDAYPRVDFQESGPGPAGSAPNHRSGLSGSGAKTAPAPRPAGP